MGQTAWKNWQPFEDSTLCPTEWSIPQSNSKVSMYDQTEFSQKKYWWSRIAWTSVDKEQKSGLSQISCSVSTLLQIEKFPEIQKIIQVPPISVRVERQDMYIHSSSFLHRLLCNRYFERFLILPLALYIWHTSRVMLHEFRDKHFHWTHFFTFCALSAEQMFQPPI